MARAELIQEYGQMKSKSPYRKSIWNLDKRYAINDISIGPVEQKVIARLMSVDSAKKNTPPVPIGSLLEISAKAKKLPRADKATSKAVEAYLESTLMLRGAGITTLICMLAIEKKGSYPPMDRKFAQGLRKKKVISRKEESILTGSRPKAFAEVYVAKVIPKWIETRIGRTPQEADKYWGRGGKDG